MSDPITLPLRFTPPMTVEGSPTPLVGRPESLRERLVVAGTPQTQTHRPLNASGRIPISQPPLPDSAEENSASPFDPEAIRREVEGSEEYQALKNAGYIKENPLHGKRRLAQAREELSRRIEGQGYRKLQEQLNQRAAQATSRQVIQAAAPSEQGTVRRADPLALDLDGNGLETTGLENGVLFDIDADGRIDQSSFVSGGDAFLALDANGNGRIDDGRELFGDQNGDANGYLALSRYDDNADGVIDRNDNVFQQLRLFTQGSDGTQRLRSLEGAGIASLSLGYRNTDIALNRYDTIAQLSTFERTDGSIGQSGDLLLGHKTTN